LWSDAYGPGDSNRDADAEKKRSPVSLYMHLPFCESLSCFARATSIIRKDKGVTPPYLSVLKKEIDHIASGFRAIARFRNSTGARNATYLSPER